MGISFEQVRKDLYAAEFRVLHGQTPIGQLRFQGRPASREGEWSGHLWGRSLRLYPEPKCPGFRPYGIQVDGAAMGSVGIMDKKSGLFSRYQYHELCYDGEVYELYSVGLGKQGSAGCLYRGHTQLAQIDKAARVHDDLHRFEIFAEDEAAAFISVLMCCNMYTRGCYRAGEKVSSSVSTQVTVTANKVLLSKYDPDFKAKSRTI